MLSKQLNLLYSVIETGLDIHMPKQTIRCGQKKILNEPWLTKGILASSKRCKKLYRQYLDGTILKQKYVEYRNSLNRIKRRAKIFYYANYFATNQSNMKMCWKMLNRVLGRVNDKSSLPTYILDNGIKVTDPKVMSNKFNEFFGNVGKTYNQRIPKSVKPALSYLGKNICTEMVLNIVNERQVASIITRLKNKKSFGNDELSNYFLKRINCILCKPLCIIINKALTSGIFPKRWKNAIVSPLYKSGFEHLITNYRPISLLPTMSKVLEKVIYEQTYDYLICNNLYAAEQFGFRSNHSCIDCVNRFYYDVELSRQNGNYMFALYLDTSKAFDSISKNILLSKLKHYGITNTSLNLFENYFTDRSQTVKINKFLSDEKKLEYGVGQGSILGPLVFNIITMDLFSIPKYCRILGYADDVTMYHSYHNIVTAYGRIKHDLRIVLDWFKANKLTINMNKTSFMLFGNNRSYSYPNKITVDNDCIDRVHTTKLLGIVIDDKCTWLPQINNVIAKLNQGLFSLKSTKHLLPTHVKIKIYYSFIYSHLSYGIELWGNTCSDRTIKRLQVFQNNCLRNILKLHNRENVAHRFKDIGLLNVENIVKYHTLKFMYRYSTDTCPLLLRGILETPITHSYNTRTQVRNVIIKPCLYSKCLDLWGNIPNQIKNQTYKSFSKSVKKILLDRQ